MKPQVIVIHGGDTFNTYQEYLSFIKSVEIDFGRYQIPRKDWKRNFPETLGDSYEVIFPDMPNKLNAKYAEWKIWFEKFNPHFEDGVIFVGHSLGGIFLAKYFSENHFSKTVKGIFLVAAPFGEPELADFILPKDLSLLEKQSSHIFLYYSEDDYSVPLEDGKQYNALLPAAVMRTFKDRGHFNQESFPEIVTDLKSLA